MKRIILVALAILAGTATGQVQVVSAGSGLWSSTATWAGGVVPTIGEAIIRAGDTVTLDMNLTGFGADLSITIEGSLVFSTTPSSIRVEATQILVRNGGTLKIGGASVPYSGIAEIVLYPSSPSATGVLAVDYGGTIKMFGYMGNRKPFGRLASTLSPMSSSIVMLGNPQWVAGDQIVVASTDLDCLQAEEFIVTGSSVGATTTTYTLDHPAAYEHYVGDLASGITGVTRSMPITAEVGLLNRRIRIIGMPDPNSPMKGGHVRIGLQAPPPTRTSASASPSSAITQTPPVVKIEGVEFTNLGDYGQIGHYPLHFHWAGALTQATVEACSFRDNFNRSLTIHESTGVTVKRNVSYKTYGHAYYLEDGTERGCVFDSNLGLSTLKATTNPITPQDAKPATFWISTMESKYINNVSAGSQGTGFWIQNIHEAYTPHSIDTDPTALPVEPDLTGSYVARWQFDGNLAHSSGEHGLFRDMSRCYMFTTNSGFTAFKCGAYGIFTRNFGYETWENVRIADCQVALYAATTGYLQHDGQGTTHFKDVLVIGDSVNVGGPSSSWSADEVAAGRTLPGYSLAGIKGAWGLEIYDGVIFVEDTEFANFNDVTLPSGVRQSAALVNRLEDVKWAVDPRNAVRTTSFANVAHKVKFLAHPSQYNGNNQVAVYDMDGSITGFNVTNPISSVAASWITADSDIMLPDGLWTKDPLLHVLDDPYWDANSNAWFVPDVTSQNRGIVQLLVRDNLGTLQNQAGFMEFTRLAATNSAAHYRSYHSETGWASANDIGESSLFPVNLQHGHEYRVAMPTDSATSTQTILRSMTFSLRFSKPGQWVALRFPVTSAFDPTINSPHYSLIWRTYLRSDLLLFPVGIPPQTHVLGTEIVSYNNGAYPTLADQAGATYFVSDVNGTTNPYAVPAATAAPTGAPNPTTTKGFPYGWSWYIDTAVSPPELVLRVVLIDMATAELAPNGSGIPLFYPNNWGLPGTGTGAGPFSPLHPIYQGGMVNVDVYDFP